MPACTPNLRAGYDAHVTTLRGSSGSPLPPTMIGRPASSGLRRTSTAAWNWSRSTCRTHRCVIGSSRERSSQSSPAELARDVFPGIAVLVEQHDHHACPAAEPTEQGALADTGGRGDIVGADRIGAVLGYQAARSVEQ